MNALNVIAALSVVSALISAIVIAIDLTRRRQPMRIMNAVWVLTGMWGGVLALWAYFKFGRARANGMHSMAGMDGMGSREDAPGQPVAKAGTATEGMLFVSHQMPPSVMHMDMHPSAAATSPDTKAAGSATDGPDTAKMQGMQGMPGMGKMHGGMDGMPEMKGMPGMPGMDDNPATGNPQPPESMHGVMPMQAAGQAQAKTGMPGGMVMNMGPQRPGWQGTALSTLHCGAGCTLADLIGEWFAVAVPVAIGGSLIAGSWVLDYVLALVIGIGFQYAAIRSMESIRPGRAVVRAAKADILSLTAWQVGMYGWMALVYFVFFRGDSLDKASWTFWFMMQLAMCFGFLASFPMNALLIRLGIKKGM